MVLAFGHFVFFFHILFMWMDKKCVITQNCSGIQNGDWC